MRKRKVVVCLFIIVFICLILFIRSYNFVVITKIEKTHGKKIYQLIHEKKNHSDAFLLYQVSDEKVWYLYLKKQLLGWKVVHQNSVPLQSNEISWMKDANEKFNKIIYIGQYNNQIVKNVLINEENPNIIKINRETSLFYILQNNKITSYDLPITWSRIN